MLINLHLFTSEEPRCARNTKQNWTGEQIVYGVLPGRREYQQPQALEDYDTNWT